jgi:hypothetical protein
MLSFGCGDTSARSVTHAESPEQGDIIVLDALDSSDDALDKVARTIGLA